MISGTYRKTRVELAFISRPTRVHLAFTSRRPRVDLASGSGGLTSERRSREREQ
jgi:hypothetical protein